MTPVLDLTPVLDRRRDRQPGHVGHDRAAHITRQIEPNSSSPTNAGSIVRLSCRSR